MSPNYQDCKVCDARFVGQQLINSQLRRQDDGNWICTRCFVSTHESEMKKIRQRMEKLPESDSSISDDAKNIMGIFFYALLQGMKNAGVSTTTASQIVIETSKILLRAAEKK